MAGFLNKSLTAIYLESKQIRHLQAKLKHGTETELNSEQAAEGGLILLLIGSQHVDILFNRI